MSITQRNIFFSILGVLLFTLVCLFGCTGGHDDDDSTDNDWADDDDSYDDDDDDDDDDDSYPYSPPDKRGPYPVGVTTLYLVDESRFENWGNRFRTLPLEVWYPSTGVGGHPNTMPDMLGDLPDWVMPLLQAVYGDYFTELWNTTTSAMREAELLALDAPYPVIAFSHGYMGVRFQNVTLCEHLASHGFVVVSPDHYGNAIFTLLPGEQIVIFNPISTVTALWNRTLDISFVYREMQKMDRDDQGPWYGALDMEAFAVSGHSYGGLTSLNSGAELDFVDAIAPLNPAWIGPFPLGFSKPFFLLQGEQDMFIGGLGMNDLVEDIFNDTASTRKVFVNVLRGGHYSSTDVCTLVPPSMNLLTDGCYSPRIDPDLANRIADAYITAFLKSVLLGDDRYDDYLTANHFREEIELATVWE